MTQHMVSIALEKLDRIIRSRKGGYEELEELSRSFTTIQAAILDAEAKCQKLRARVHQKQLWKLQELAYDIEDLLDRQSAEALTSQNQVYDIEEFARISTRNALNTHLDERGRNSNNSNWHGRIHDKVSNFLLPCLCFIAVENFLLGLEIRALRNRLQEITSTKSHIDIPWNWSPYTENSQSSPEMDETVTIFGRDGDKECIIELLLLNEAEKEDHQALRIISIVGAAGLGKTTLAQLVYSDERVISHFDIRMWVDVSDHANSDFNLERIAMSIITSLSISESSWNYYASDPLRFLQEFVREKRFLIVLDDVCNENPDKWVQLRDNLQSGSWGSRILVITQIEKVARGVGTSKFHYLQPLSVDACWSVFSSAAFSKRRSYNIELKKLGRAVAKRIGGVPLFAKAWTFIFLLEVTRRGWWNVNLLDMWDAAGLSEWELSRESKVWDDVLWTLESCYVRLPSHLKPCFKYFALFPKGCWIVKEVLIQFWMAEGFLHLEDKMEENLEELGAEYFDDLLSRTSFFKDIERNDDGNIVRCKMHEPFHDFIRYASRREYTFIESRSSHGLVHSTRHSSLFCVEDTTSIPRALYDAKSMRTLLCFGNPQKIEVPRDLFSHLKVLRVLDLSSTNIRDLPHSIGALKQLRYLDLSYTRIRELPESICGLCFMQNLKLSHSLLRVLPKETRKLISLRHLKIDGTSLSYLPHGMERLTRIRELSDFIVGGDSGCSIGELGNLNLLQGRLVISNLNRLISREEAEEAKLDKKNYIDCLILDGKKHFSSQCLDRKRYFDPPVLEHMYGDIGSSNEIEVTRVQGVIEGIKPHVNLRRLELWNYVGPSFPKWMEDALLPNLVYVKLFKCVKVKHLPPLGMLPSLKCLHIHGLVEVQHMGHGFYGDGDVKGFPKLERLVLEGMPSWKVWDLSVEEGNMPFVRELIINDCPSLKTLPCLPNTLRNLEIYNCQVLPYNHSLPTVEYLVLKGRDGMLRSLPNLPKLKSLKITLSPGITSLPVGLGCLTTLKALTIHFCPKLESFPLELQQLTMLQELLIVGCPLLTERYQKERMDDWIKIAHIPNIEIDNKKIQGSEASSSSLIHPSTLQRYMSPNGRELAATVIQVAWRSRRQSNRRNRSSYWKGLSAARIQEAERFEKKQSNDRYRSVYRRKLAATQIQVAWRNRMKRFKLGG